jgi:hypothetical protein
MLQIRIPVIVIWKERLQFRDRHLVGECGEAVVRHSMIDAHDGAG